MLNIEKSVVINRPIEEVFAFVSPGENWSQWATELVESKKTSEGPLDVGTTYVHVAQMLGRRIENGYEVTEYEPNRKVSMKATSGAVPADVALTFEPVEGGTRLGLSVGRPAASSNWPSHSSHASCPDSKMPISPT